jgi:hypothetical protein
MEHNEKQTISYPERRHSTTFEGVVDTLKWVLIALILALI